MGNRPPTGEAGTEQRYRVIVTCGRPDLANVRDLLADTLEAANYPVQDIEVLTAGETVELLATRPRLRPMPMSWWGNWSSPP